MKKLLVLVLAALFSITAFAEGEVSSKVEEVTFFLSGAQVNRSADINYNSGIQEIILHDLEPGINAGSIVLTGTGDFTLLSYRYETRTKQPKNEEPNDATARALQRKIKAAEDSLSDMQYWSKNLAFRLEVLNNEKRLLLNNPINQGTAIADSLQLLQDAVAYLRQRLNEVNDALVDHSREQEGYNETRQHLQQRIAALRQDFQGRYPVKSAYYDYRLVLAVEADRAGSGNIEFTYLVNSAGWTPEIEFRSNGYGEPMEIQQRARVYQNTGKNWDNVDLLVSTSNPTSHRNKPYLQPWILSLVERAQTRNAGVLESVQVYKAEAEIDSVEEAPKELTVASYDVAQVTRVEQLAFKLFSFDRKFSIKSGSAYPLRVKLERAELDCDYRLVAVPKLYNAVFVQARFADWQEYMLPNAKAKLYYQNTFLGQLQMNKNMFADTLELSMGIDEGLSVTRELVLTKSKNSIIGKRVKQERVYRYIVENFKSTAVELYIQDHMPLSLQDGLEVERLECRNGSYTETDGMIEWKFDLGPRAKEEFECGFEVSYPKDKVLRGL